jgi:CheY-like chemotaxis protein
VAAAAGGRRLALFHHDPRRDDQAIDGVIESTRRRLAAVNATVEVFAAAEGQLLELLPAPPEVDRTPGPTAGARAEPVALDQQSVLVAVADSGTAELLSEAVRADDLRLSVAADADSALAVARATPLSLVLLERTFGSRDGLAICRALRDDPAAKDVPIVIVAASQQQVNHADGLAAGVTDWLVKPFKSAYARTRIRAWVLREACRWQKPPIPPDEDERLRALRRLRILDTDPEERIDRLTRIGAAVFNVPIVLVSLVDHDRQWFKSARGCNFRETSREASFCGHAILSDDVMIVPDALTDHRFADSPLVTSDPHIRFYAGCPITVEDSRRVGTLCLMDCRPRQLDDAGVRLLRELARMVEEELRAPGRENVASSVAQPSGRTGR